MKKVPSINTSLHPVTIVLSGNTAVTRGVYLQLCKKYSKQITSGSVRIIIVTTQLNYHFYGFLSECISGVLNDSDVEIRVEAFYTLAKVIFGRIIENQPEKNRVIVDLSNGDKIVIGYAHFVNCSGYFNTGLLQTDKTSCIHINSTATASHLHSRLKELVDRAARAADRIHAARILSVTVGSTSAAGFDVAAAVRTCLNRYCCEYGLNNIIPTVYLVTPDAAADIAGTHTTQADLYKHHKVIRPGIRIVTGKKIVRINTDGAVINDGSFISCSLVVDTIEAGSETPATNTVVNAFGKHPTYNNWIAPASCTNEMPAPSGYFAAIRQGKIIGFNIAASIENTSMKKLKIYNEYQLAGLSNTDTFPPYGKLTLSGALAVTRRYLLFLSAMPVHLCRKCAFKIFDALRQHFGKTNKKAQLQVLQKFVNSQPVARLV